MQAMATPIFKSAQHIDSQMLHGLNMLPSPSSAFHPPPITYMYNFCKDDN